MLCGCGVLVLGFVLFTVNSVVLFHLFDFVFCACLLVAVGFGYGVMFDVVAGFSMYVGLNL